jgi:hypothetical protein
MKHLRTFENFSINENTTGSEDIKNNLTQKVKDKVNAEVKKLSSDQKEQAAREIADFCLKTGLSVEDLTNTDKVTAALEKMEVNPSKERVLDESLLTEGKFGEWWKGFKQKHAKLFKGLGIASLVIGGVTLGIDAELANLNLRDVSDINRSMGGLSTIGLSAVALGAMALNIGLNNIKQKIKK